MEYSVYRLFTSRPNSQMDDIPLLTYPFHPQNRRDAETLQLQDLTNSLILCASSILRNPPPPPKDTSTPLPKFCTTIPRPTDMEALLITFRKHHDYSKNIETSWRPTTTLPLFFPPEPSPLHVLLNMEPEMRKALQELLAQFGGWWVNPSDPFPAPNKAHREIRLPEN